MFLEIFCELQSNFLIYTPVPLRGLFTAFAATCVRCLSHRLRAQSHRARVAPSDSRPSGSRRLRLLCDWMLSVAERREAWHTLMTSHTGLIQSAGSLEGGAIVSTR